VGSSRCASSSAPGSDRVLAIHVAMDYKCEFREDAVLPLLPARHARGSRLPDKVKERILFALLLIATSRLLVPAPCMTSRRRSAGDWTARSGAAAALSCDARSVAGAVTWGAFAASAAAGVAVGMGRPGWAGARPDGARPGAGRDRMAASPRVRPGVRSGAAARHTGGPPVRRAAIFAGFAWAGLVTWKLVLVALAAILLMTSIADRSRLDPGVKRFAPLILECGSRNNDIRRDLLRESRDVRNRAARHRPAASRSRWTRWEETWTRSLARGRLPAD